MTPPEERVQGSTGSLERKDEFPRFRLEFYYDEPDDPERVTIFDPDADGNTTAWISSAVDEAVPIETVC